VIMHRHLSRMTLREKLAQMIMIDFRFDDADYDRTMRLVKKEGVGGVTLSGGSIFEMPSFVNSLQKVAKFPLLVAADYEDGAGAQVGGATRFPSSLAVGATGSEELAELKARQVALEARALGVRWVLAPPVRPGAFGSDEELAGRLSRAFVRGLHSIGSLGCARRFPGSPALAAVAAEVDAILAGDTLTADVTGEALRGDLDFAGLLCVDASAAPPADAERLAKAGADLLFWPGDSDLAIQVLEESVKSGRLAEAAVDRSVERILSAKERLGLFTDRMTDVAGVELAIGSMGSRLAGQRIAEAALTLVRGSGRTEGPVAVFHHQDEGLRGDLGIFAAELARKRTVSEAAELGVLAIFPAGGGPASESLLARIREVRERTKDVILVVFGPPSALRGLPAEASVVCAYGPDAFSQRAAAKAVASAIGYAGRLPAGLEA